MHAAGARRKAGPVPPDIIWVDFHCISSIFRDFVQAVARASEFPRCVVVIISIQVSCFSFNDGEKIF
jgi:hypothetical protein